MNEAELMQRFGNPVLERCDSGWCVPDVSWCSYHLVSANTLAPYGPPQYLLVNRRIWTPLVQVFTSINTEWITQIYGWSPRCKMLNPARDLSLHAWGLAIDVNWDENKHGAPNQTTPRGFIDCMKANGFVWGGDWSTPDPMHFELQL